MTIEDLIKAAQKAIPNIIALGGDAAPYIREMIVIAAKPTITEEDFDRIKALEKSSRDELQEEEPE